MESSNEQPLLALPKELLEDIVGLVGEGRFPEGDLLRERELSAKCGDLSWFLGVWAGKPLRYGLLRDPAPAAISLPNYTDLGPDWPPNWREQITGAERRLLHGRGVQRAYCGWLCVCPAFLREQEAFLRTHRSHVAQRGMRLPLGFWHHGADHSTDDAYTSDLAAFLARWDLLGMAGPFLPEPIGIQFPAVVPTSDRFALDRGAYLYVPRIYPLPDRQELREMAGDAARPSSDANISHLNPWLAIVSARTGTRKKIAQFERLFVFQHFWHVIHLRWGHLLDGNRDRILRLLVESISLTRSDADTDRLVRSSRDSITELNITRGVGWECESFLPE